MEPKKEDQQGLNMASEAVLVKSTQKLDAPVVKGYDFEDGINFDKMMGMYKNMGF